MLSYANRLDAKQELKFANEAALFAETNASLLRCESQHMHVQLTLNGAIRDVEAQVGEISKIR